MHPPPTQQERFGMIILAVFALAVIALVAITVVKA